MKSVAPHDRPREKLERVGAGGLGDNELLAIVLGHGVPRCRRARTRQRGARVGGRTARSRTGVDSTTSGRCPGIGAARAAQLIAAIEAGRRTLVRGRRDRPQIVEPA